MFFVDVGYVQKEEAEGGDDVAEEEEGGFVDGTAREVVCRRPMRVVDEPSVQSPHLTFLPRPS